MRPALGVHVVHQACLTLCRSSPRTSCWEQMGEPSWQTQVGLLHTPELLTQEQPPVQQQASCLIDELGHMYPLHGCPATGEGAGEATTMLVLSQQAGLPMLDSWLEDWQHPYPFLAVREDGPLGSVHEM